MNQAGLYIHIPFCKSKCGYCSFNSIPAQRHQANEYLHIITDHIAGYVNQPHIKKQTFDSIFFGGGTPTLASPEQLGKLLDYLLNHFSFTRQIEISIEANPNSISKKDLRILHHAGFNRISLGIQSFQDAILTRINRTHTGQQARQAVRMARKAGFTTISCDLIYGLPEQTVQHWQTDLNTVLELDPEHLSLYELTVEPGTAFYSQQQAQQLILPDDDILADMEELSAVMLSPVYQQYEISNFAKNNNQCRHNLTYWHNNTYLGFGAGAVSCINGMRFSHQPSPKLFAEAVEQKKNTITYAESLSPKARFRETIIMCLRLVQGVNLPLLEQQTRLSHQQVYGTLLEDLIRKEQLKYNRPYLCIPITLLGVANQILQQLV
jgi:oxygen-independent coproporphyrinogen-3 oxidase